MFLSTIILLLNNNKINENFKHTINFNSSNIIHNNIYILTYITIILLFTTIPAVLVATNCNPNNPLLYGILAFIFSDIYLLQWSIKKFIFRFNNYCKL